MVNNIISSHDTETICYYIFLTLQMNDSLQELVTKYLTPVFFLYRCKIFRDKLLWIALTLLSFIFVSFSFNYKQIKANTDTHILCPSQAENGRISNPYWTRQFTNSWASLNNPWSLPLSTVLIKDMIKRKPSVNLGVKQ